MWLLGTKGVSWVEKLHTEMQKLRQDKHIRKTIPSMRHCLEQGLFQCKVIDLLERIN